MKNLYEQKSQTLSKNMFLYIWGVEGLSHWLLAASSAGKDAEIPFSILTFQLQNFQNERPSNMEPPGIDVVSTEQSYSLQFILFSVDGQ